MFVCFVFYATARQGWHAEALCSQPEQVNFGVHEVKGQGHMAEARFGSPFGPVDFQLCVFVCVFVLVAAHTILEKATRFWHPDYYPDRAKKFIIDLTVKTHLKNHVTYHVSLSSWTLNSLTVLLCDVQVWCCALSNDNELAVSGSRDHTIRMWRVSDGTAVAAIDAGVDVFRVLISNNKKTVVALADKFAARKLIMLQVVRRKTKTSTSSSRTAMQTTVI